MINIEINGTTIEAKEGAMVIEAADDAGIYIPRFCYHKKLSIAANCRMCLIEVEKAGKPLPACATPVTDGMKIFTRSEKAVSAQKDVMEFLLINHPLDCPICDQGGECELQDIAMGYGTDFSEYGEQKRVVLNKDLGPLISTDMTRCIHCTRCVRFGDEIAGIRELGATGRGEHVEIGTYVKMSVGSELSGNIIDLCPVGALTSKPFRFSARAWELIQRDTIAPHDCIGSNLSVHIRDNRVVRVVPNENEAINETWISDRDRYSYEALNSEERLSTPMIKINGEWQSTDWNTALQQTVEGLQKIIDQNGAKQIGALASATSTIEELYLFQKLMRSLGVANIDHRIRQIDFEGQESAPVFPWLGQSIPDLENNDAVLLIGSNIRCDQPLAAHRLRKACSRGAKIFTINSVDYDFYLPIAEKIIINPALMTAQLAGVAKAVLLSTGEPAPIGFDKLLGKVTPTDSQQKIAAELIGNKHSSILLGPLAINHPEYSKLNSLAGLIAKLSDSRLGYLSEAGNSVGAWLAGVLPHRSSAGIKADTVGVNAIDMLSKSLKAYVLLNLEPEIESAAPNVAAASLQAADFVVAMTLYSSPALQSHADVMLPIAAFSETDGTFVNAEGLWQSFTSAVSTPDESRPAWKILRVLGNLLECEGFDYITANDVLAELKNKVGEIQGDNSAQWNCPSTLTSTSKGIFRISETQMYAGDAIQRRAKSLQRTTDAVSAALRINDALASRLGLAEGDNVIAQQQSTKCELPLVIDNRISDDSVLIHSGLEASASLSYSLEPISLTKAN